MKKIHLTQDKYAIVDDDDFDWLNQWKWYAVCKSKSRHLWYACRSVTVGYHWIGKRKKFNQKKQYMHRIVLNNPELFVDHINRDGLDNRKCNLRICDCSQNMGNQAKMKGKNKYKGVCSAGNGWFKASIKCKDKTNNQQIIIGKFKTEEQEALAYNEYAIKFFGEFARINEVKLCHAG